MAGCSPDPAGLSPVSAATLKPFPRTTRGFRPNNAPEDIMKRLITLLACASLLVLTGCDRFGGTLVDPDPVSEDLAFEITVAERAPLARSAPLRPQARAFEATGALHDRSSVEGNPWPADAPAYWVGYRQFTTERGAFEIVIEAGPTPADRHALARGTFTLTGADGTHAGLYARGTFVLARDAGGPSERYTGLLE